VLFLGSFVLASSALSLVTSSPPFMSYLWGKYFQVATVADLVAGQPVEPAPSPTLCGASIKYEGGSILSAACAVLFVVSIFEVCHACCLAPLIVDGLRPAPCEYQLTDKETSTDIGQSLAAVANARSEPESKEY